MSHLTPVSLVVWMADPFLEGQSDAFFREEMSVLNTTHMMALLESRLQRRRGYNVAVGAVEYYDDEVKRWMPLLAEHDVSKFSLPIKLKMWSRKRHFTCRVHPLRATHEDYLPRRIAVKALDLAGLREELRASLPPHEHNFHDILLCDPSTMGWALLEDLGTVPVGMDHLDLKLIPSEHSVSQGDVLAAPQAPIRNDADRLRHVMALEKTMTQTPPQPTSMTAPRNRLGYHNIPSVATQYGDTTVEMPVRIGATPLSHTSAEIRSLHNPERQGVAPSERKAPLNEPNRNGCCYPGSGQTNSVDSSRHGELKRQAIGYIRTLLQDPESPLQEYLPLGGLPTADLVNLTALAAHYFMIRCPLRPDTNLTSEDRSELHSILAQCIAEHPFAQRAPDEDPQQKKGIPRREEPTITHHVYTDTHSRDSPQVVLMQPAIDTSGSVTVYGTVTCPNAVECKWILKAKGETIDIDAIFATGLAVTSPISSSCFSLTLLPGMYCPAIFSSPPYHSCETII